MSGCRGTTVLVVPFLPNLWSSSSSKCKASQRVALPRSCLGGARSPPGQSRRWGVSAHTTPPTLIDEARLLLATAFETKRGRLVQCVVASGRYNAGMRSPVRRAKRIVHTWKQAQVLLERWRKNLTDVQVELKQPRVIDVTPIDFVSGEPVECKGTHTTKRLRGQLIYFTNADVMIRLVFLADCELLSDRHGRNFLIVYLGDGLGSSCEMQRCPESYSSDVSASRRETQEGKLIRSKRYENEAGP
jgi:hypothetical protein